MKIEEILIVCHDNVCFGIPTYLVGQILRVPDMTALALSPKEVHGMCAVGGNITTAVDMNLLLGMKKVDITSQKSRILTLNDDLDTSALVVSEVIATVVVDPKEVEYIVQSDDPIVAIYHYQDQMIQIVDVKKILKSVRLREIEANEISEKHELLDIRNDAKGAVSRYLLFRMGGEVYGMEIDNLREILSAQQTITPLSGSVEEIVGMMSLREELILIVDLRLRYGYEPMKSDKNRILITQIRSKVVGLIIDEIIDIKGFDESQIEMFDESEEGKISGVIHEENHLISTIGSEDIQKIIHENNSLIISSQNIKTDAKTNVVCEAVVFKLGSEEYALNIENVDEIIDMTPVTPIAQAPESVEGVVNIRGQIVTIGSLHRRLNIKTEEGAEQKIIICGTSKGRMGFFVDSVSDVLEIHNDELHAESNEHSVFSHILHLNGGDRLVMMLDLGQIYR